MNKRYRSDGVKRILSIYDRHGISSRLLKVIKEELVEKDNEADLICILDSFLEHMDFYGVHEIVKLNLDLLDHSAELIGQKMREVPIRRIYDTKGWLSLAKMFVKHSPTLRQYIFQLLASDEVKQMDAWMNSTRDNLLIVCLELHLLKDEIDIIRKLGAAMPRPEYREYCDELLLRTLDKEEQEKARLNIILKSCF